MNVKIKYFDEGMPKLAPIKKGDWMDLRVVSAINMMNTIHEIDAGQRLSKKYSWNSENRLYYLRGDVIICRLGVAMQLPEGYKARIYPRSSTFAKKGLILTNSVGCIDNSYSGDGDEWIVIMYATRSGYLEQYERLVQFELAKINEFTLDEVTVLDNENRDGYGSTGQI